jgi:hypothetical protein
LFIIVVSVFTYNDEVNECEMERACSTNGAKRHACRILVGKPEEKRPLGRLRRRCPDLVMWDFVMDKSGAGAGFLRELRFPLPIYIPSAP